MGIRFQKRIKIAPGVRLNLSRGLPSVSVGGHGLTANLSKRGVMTTTSIPHSGVSYRHRWNPEKHGAKRHDSHLTWLQTFGLLTFGCFILLFSTLCSNTSTPRPQAATPATSLPWTPERIEKSGIFKDEPTATPSPTPHVTHKKRRHRAR
jgi:hypothetical protein